VVDGWDCFGIICRTPSPYLRLLQIQPTGPMIDPAWIRPVVEHPASTHATCAPEDLITNQEELSKGVIEDVLSDMYGTSGDILDDALDVWLIDEAVQQTLLEKWKIGVQRFTERLDWSIWDGCKSGGGPEVRVFHSWLRVFAR